MTENEKVLLACSIIAEHIDIGKIPGWAEIRNSVTAGINKGMELGLQDAAKIVGIAVLTAEDAEKMIGPLYVDGWNAAVGHIESGILALAEYRRGSLPAEKEKP